MSACDKRQFAPRFAAWPGGDIALTHEKGFGPQTRATVCEQHAHEAQECKLIQRLSPLQRQRASKSRDHATNKHQLLQKEYF